MSNFARFRIRPEHLGDVLNFFASCEIKPLRVYDRRDGEVAVEVPELTEDQGKKLAIGFRHEWSAIIGIVRNNPLETRH